MTGKKLGKAKFDWLSQLPLRQEIKVEEITFVNIFHSTPTKCRGGFSYPSNEQANFGRIDESN